MEIECRGEKCRNIGPHPLVAIIRKFISIEGVFRVGLDKEKIKGINIVMKLTPITS